MEQYFEVRAFTRPDGRSRHGRDASITESTVITVTRGDHAPTRSDVVVVRAAVPEGGSVTQLSADAVSEGLTRMFELNERFALAADRMGLSVDGLIATLEHVDIAVVDARSSLPAAEVEALTDVGIDLSGRPDDPAGVGQLALTEAHVVRFRADALTVAEAADRVGLSTSRVRQLIGAGDLIAIPGQDGHLLPDWQFVGDGIVPALSKLGAESGVASTVHPLALARFMTRPDVDLVVDGRPVTPVQWLVAGGDPDRVAALAASLDIVG